MSPWPLLSTYLKWKLNAIKLKNTTTPLYATSSKTGSELLMGLRTHDLVLTKDALYQLSYSSFEKRATTRFSALNGPTFSSCRLDNPRCTFGSLQAGLIQIRQLCY